MQTGLSDLLESIHLRGTSWLLLELGSNLSIAMPKGHAAVLYVPLEGTATLRTGKDRLTLTPGNAAILLHGHAHRLDVGAHPTKLLPLTFDEQNRHDIPPVISLGEAGSQPARLILGRLMVDAAPGSPLISMVPNLLSLALRDPQSLAFNPGLLHSLTKRPGASAYLTHFAELMLCRALQEFLCPDVENQSQTWSALHSLRIMRAVNLITKNPKTAWTVALLAREVGMSRSSFAAEFVAVAGKPPMHFVAEQRLELAAKLLVKSKTSIASVAHAVGYDSEPTFARVFKRRFGVSAKIYRCQMGAGKDATGQATHEKPNFIN